MTAIDVFDIKEKFESTPDNELDYFYEERTDDEILVMAKDLGRELIKSRYFEVFSNRFMDALDHLEESVIVKHFGNEINILHKINSKLNEISDMFNMHSIHDILKNCFERG